MAAAICRQYMFWLRYEVLSVSLQSSFFIFHFLGLSWMCPVCQGRRVAVSGPLPLFGFGMILLCASHNSGLKKKAKLFLNFEIISDFEKSWENVVQSVPAHSSYTLPKCWHFTVCCYHSVSVAILLLLLVKPFESKSQTWCPFTPEHLCVYFLKNNAIFYNQYSY